MISALPVPYMLSNNSLCTGINSNYTVSILLVSADEFSCGTVAGSVRNFNKSVLIWLIKLFSPGGSERAGPRGVFAVAWLGCRPTGDGEAWKTSLFASPNDRVSITLDRSARSPGSCHRFSAPFRRSCGANTPTSRAETPTFF